MDNVTLTGRVITFEGLCRKIIKRADQAEGPEKVDEGDISAACAELKGVAARHDRATDQPLVTPDEFLRAASGPYLAESNHYDPAKLFPKSVLADTRTALHFMLNKDMHQTLTDLIGEVCYGSWTIPHWIVGAIRDFANLIGMSVAL
jgi:hypothetical protein